MRIDQKALTSLLKNQNLRVHGDFGGATITRLKMQGMRLPESPESPESDVWRVIQSIETSRIETQYIPGIMFEATFRGAHLLSLNKLLRLDHRTGNLKRYRAACHAAAERSVVLATGQSIKLREPLPKGLAVSLFRYGAKPFDNDALVASYKFIIDGFRCAGLIVEDDPSHIASFDRLIQRCGHDEAPSIGISFHGL